MDETVWCRAHDTPIQACNGPHRYVRTSNGLELLEPGQTPVGTPHDQPDTGEAFGALDRLWSHFNPGKPNPRKESHG